jgi:hypothetical protein
MVRSSGLKAQYRLLTWVLESRWMRKCQVTSFIDFEGTTIPHLWACATVPIWLLPEDDHGGFTDGSSAEKELLRSTFLEEIRCSHDGEEWLNAYEMGRGLRTFMYRLQCSASTWTPRSWARWMQDRFDWAQLHPGVACHNTNEYHIDFYI